MICPKCQSKTKIIESRPLDDECLTYRRHKCINCNFIFCTEESIIDDTASLRYIWSNSRSKYYYKKVEKSS